MDQSQIQYYIYARKSSEAEDRQALSIESQNRELMELARKSNLKVVEKRNEAKSAKAPGREIFNKTLDDIEKEKAQGLIVWHPDRLSRNSVDTGRLIYLFDLGKLQEVVTPTQVFKNTPNDKFLLNLLCSQAKLDNDNKSVNVKRGLRAKCELGIYPCPAPTGYLNDKYAEKGNKKLIPDPDRFNLVQKMFSLVLSQKLTPIQVLRIANEEWHLRMKNGRKMARNTIYHILSNPVYAGVFEYPLGSGKWYRGIHKPMLTPEEFDMVQAILGVKGNHAQKNIFLLLPVLCDAANAVQL
jgi:DNA invertase Pin-like site-specific DNA recombinase